MENPERGVHIENVIDLCRDTSGMLGPLGTGTLVVDQSGNVTVTSSPAVLLDELDIDDPSLTLTANAAGDFRERHRDGTGRMLAVAGACLARAERLVERGIHPTTIADGYRRSVDLATDTIDDIADPATGDAVERTAVTALTGTRDPHLRETIGDYITEAMADIDSRDGHRTDIDVIARLGAAQSETELVEGAVVDADPVAEGMARRCVGAGIAALSDDVDVEGVGTATGRRGTTSVTMETESYDDVAAVADAERASFEETVRSFRERGGRCLVTSGSINDRVKTKLATEGVLALHQLDDADVARIARATGATVVPTLGEVTADALGYGDVSVSRKGGRDMTIIRSGDGDEGGGVYTLFCRAPDPRSVQAFERSVEGAIAAADAARTSGVVPGGGAVEMAIATRVRTAARSRADREQLAMEAFAEAVEAVPRALARNAGIDGTDARTDLRARHADGDRRVGVDVLGGALVDVTDEGILDAASLTVAALTAATDLSVQLVRIDDVVSASDLSDEDGDGESTVESRVGDT
ncbi:MAG: TCP-1/cpn60 chaperonin family protein [Haloplanus sp.]